jgi:4-amino-4-deoxy-L-arabinose transferase-like glycosyltransferase
VAAIYFFLRRYRKGSELDGALITASCVGVIGFAHAAATDMPLAACFSIALLAWYAWYESQRRIYLAAFYVFLALGTLAKGPVAPALAAVIIVLFFIVRFIAIRRDWRGFWGTLWVPGIILYLAVALPWYVAVQLRNPEFFRVFILEHNLARFSQDVYHHRQPFWFYVPVFLLAMMPWTLVLILAIAERVRVLWAEGKQKFSRPEDLCSENSWSENSWSLFLLIWMVVPVLFFSASQSKLPGYILPAVPAGALLVAEYLDARRRASGKLSLGIVAGHAMLCGVLIFAAVSAASMAMNHRLVWGQGTWVAAAMGGGLALGIGAALLSAGGLRLLSRVTLFAVVVSVAAVVRFAAPVIDDTRSARPIAESIEAFSHEPVPVAIYRVKRGQEYGLEFYLNRPAEKYEDGNIPAAEHVLVAAQGSQPQVAELVPGRRVSYLTSIPEQKLELYWVGK